MNPGKAYAFFDFDASKEEIENKTEKDSVFYTDGWKSYASLEQYGKHNIIDHDKELVNNYNHINGIEGSFVTKEHKNNWRARWVSKCSEFFLYMILTKII